MRDWIDLEATGHAATSLWAHGVYLTSLTFRALAVFALLPLYVFLMVELAGYAVILSTGMWGFADQAHNATGGSSSRLSPSRQRPCHRWWAVQARRPAHRPLRRPS